MKMPFAQNGTRHPGRLPRTLFLFISLLAGSLVANSATSKIPEPVRSDSMQRIIGRMVASRISRLHYSQRPLDDTVSRQLFDEYFDTLDHNRYFFLESDIEEFSSYKLVLDDLLLRGNVEFAYDIYARFLERVHDRLDMLQQRLKQPFDFTLDEEMLFDRSKMPWCKDVLDLDELWRLRLKNNLLTYSMMKDPPKPATKKPQETTPDKETGQRKETPPAVATQPKTPEEKTLKYYDRYLHQLVNRDAMDILELYLSSLTRVYDPHSAYMAPSTEEDFDIQMKLSLQGIGALLTTEDGYVKIVDIIPGGPAEQDGRLKAGDRIIAVAQEDAEPVDVFDMPLRKVVQLIRGPKDTEVVLTVIEAAKGLGSVPVQITIVRGKVKLTEQEAKGESLIIDADGNSLPPETTAAKSSKILHITLPSFYLDFEGRQKGISNYKSSSRDVQNLIAKHPNLDGLILDLRGNGGGSLDEAVDLAGLFFPKGPVVQTRYYDGSTKVLRDRNGSTSFSGPMVVLVDRLSASASEIVAAAMQDYHRAVVIGESSTHGKGTIQTLYHLARDFQRSPLLKDHNPGTIKFTIGKFYRINGGATQLKGVVPDIVFPSFTDYMELGEARLPHALPWDSIKPLAYSPWPALKDMIPLLKQNSLNRCEKDPKYQEHLQDIKTFGTFRSRKTVSLNRERRQKLQEEEEAFSQRTKKIGTRAQQSDNSDPSNEPKKDDKTPDFVLDEALHVLADITLMAQNGAQTARQDPPVNK
jgi:carboxyl-terminal processing protease